jgi:NADH-quinone oxidoreductase subunit J
VHAALFLVLAFFTASCLWMLLSAEFLAITLVLVYVGAVMVLFLFGVMLTRAKLGAETDLNNKHHLLGVPVALLLFGVMVWVLVDGFRDTKLPQGADAEPVSVQQVSDSIFSPYLLPFWALSFVLLAAVIGAIVLARKD